MSPTAVRRSRLPQSGPVACCTFDRHTLDGAEARAALLDLVVTLGRLLRHRGQAARALTLTLKFAGGTSWEKTRRLAEASAHDEDLRAMAYRLIDAVGLQRGRLTGIALRQQHGHGEVAAGGAMADAVEVWCAGFRPVEVALRR